MRILMLAAAAIVSLNCVAIGDESPAVPPVFSVNPVTKEFLRNLDSEQVRLLRRSIKGCPGRAIRSERNPCVITTTDRAIEESGNPDLIAFHKGLRVTDRYDETRTGAAWFGFLPKP